MNQKHDDPRRPSAPAPESVEHSVYEEAEYAGAQGADASDPPLAAEKSDRAAGTPAAGPGSDLDPDESADLMETREEAHRIKQTRDDQREDGGLISLDPGD